MQNARFLFAAFAVAFGAATAAAQVPPPADAKRLAPAEIETLVAPIALYPDPLVALILPAATNPAEVVLAARFLDRKVAVETASNEPWDDSVKALVRYPEVVRYLDENLEWTRSLGECFLVQPNDVMGAIQAVRGRARTNGLLADTPQQQVIIEESVIQIVPAQPTVIYVPRYDPEILYVSHTPSYYHRPSTFLSFGIGYHVGSWLSYDCDWRYRNVHIVHRPSHWYHQPDWRRRHYPHVGLSWTRWAPSPRHPYYHNRSPRPYQHVTLRPNRPWDGRRDHDHDRRRDGDRDRSGDGQRHWQRPPQVQPAVTANTFRPDNNSARTDKRDPRVYRERAQPTMPANSFAATPAPAAPVPAVAQPVPTTVRRPQANGERPNFRREDRPRTFDQPRPADQPRQYSAPRQHDAPRQRPQVATTQPTPSAPRAYTPPPQQPAPRSHEQPAPRQYRRENSDDGGRSSNSHSETRNHSRRGDDSQFSRRHLN